LLVAIAIATSVACDLLKDWLSVQFVLIQDVNWDCSQLPWTWNNYN